MEIVYWNDKVQRLIKDLDKSTTSRVGNVINLLTLHGNLLDMPDSKSLGHGLFELRTHGKPQIRILYIFHNDKAYIVHGFIKKTWKIQFRDLRYARKIQDQIRQLE